MRNIILLITLLIGFSSFSQVLSGDREKFVKEFDKLMKESTSFDLKEFTQNDLPAIFISSKLSDSDFSKIVSTANRILEKRLTPYPLLYGYVFSAYSLLRDNQSKESFEAWHDALIELLEGKNTKKFKDFISISENFLKNRIIGSNSNYNWHFNGGGYNFQYEDEIKLILTDGKLACRIINRGKNSENINFSDSIVVKNTSGYFDIIKGRFFGEGGTISWEKVGLDPSLHFAELKSFMVSVRGTVLTCDTAMMHSPFINSIAIGKIVDRSMKGNFNEDKQLNFPQFVSFQEVYEIKNLIEDVDYFGGFSMQGSEFVGIGSESNPATLRFYQNGDLFLKSASNVVRVSEKQLLTDRAKTTIYIGKEDSITHLGLNFIFFRDRKELELTRGNSGISSAPFINTYHKLEMYVEKIIWKPKENILDLTYNFSTSEQKRSARFESFDYYNVELYQKQQALEKVNPLAALYKYCYKYDKYTITSGEAATAIGKTIEECSFKLIELASLGFITYDSEKQIVIITDKLIRFVEANSGKKDFDYISFSANLIPIYLDGISPDQLKADKDLRAYKERMLKRNQDRSKLKSFGTLDLSNFNLVVDAVDVVPISFSKNTMIFPDNSRILVKQNRDFVFDGWINSGKWEIRVNDGNYYYEDNKFSIIESDIAFFRANPLRKEDGGTPILISSSLYGLKGELFVDHKDNRSGNKKGESFDIYPLLSSKEKTKVFYNYKKLYLGAYDSTRFYFEINPFELDSLHAFNERTLRFGGALVSGGIFPKFQDSIRLMNDYSLGLTKDIPESGYDFYDNGGKFFNKIILSNNGLQGSGDLKFITSTSSSKGLFTFLPDSTFGYAKFTNSPQDIGVEYPDVVGEDVYLTYLPRKGKLNVKSSKELIYFFNQEANLQGTATIDNKGLTGNGFMNFSHASLFSKKYSYTRWNILSDTSYFKLKNKYREPGDLTQEEFAFQADNVVSNVSFKDRIGNFESNSDGSIAKFPMNSYICKIDMFQWLLDNDELELKSPDDNVNIDSDMDIVESNFFSVDPKRDSLNFRSGNARYSVEDKSIYCYETRFVQIADSRIFPDSMKIVIREKGVMDTLFKAKIISNYITKYHEITDVQASIETREKYEASGRYKYIDVDSNIYYFDLTRIYLDSTLQTIGLGKVNQDENFKLSSAFDYYGDIKLIASEPYLRYTGATRINHSCEKFEKNWMAFSSYLNPKNIQIPVMKEMKDLEGNFISAGILWRNSQDLDKVTLYPTFLSGIEEPNDPVVITASGWLQYNKISKEYQIGNKDKLINRGEKGNYIALHTESCSLNGDGRVNLGMDYGNLESEAVGVVNYNQSTGETSMNLTLKIKAPMDVKLFENVGKKIYQLEDLKDVDFNSTTLEQSIVEWENRETADKIKSDYTLRKEIKKVPKSFESSIVFTGLRISSFTDDDNIKGIRTSSEKAAIVNFYGEPVMKYVPLKAFFEQRTIMPDRFGLLIDLPGSSVYFFDYDNRKTGIMSILSNDEELNEGINALKADKRKDKKFMYQTTQSSTYKSQFLRIFE
ncbi:MAG: hypothetical protein P8O07_06485 [Crocinitomicaceae bacterium]|nr:hypothetical protein [Crocinitomicaceae bacterium]